MSLRWGCLVARHSSRMLRRYSGFETLLRRVLLGLPRMAAATAKACGASLSLAESKVPAVKLAPAGVTARELIEEFSGGMADGHLFKAYLPGGASGGILPASMADLPLDFGTLEQYGCFVGSHAVVILSDRDDMKAVALNLMRFFEDESCGQCTPCRAGTEKAAKLMERGPWDEALLKELCGAMRDASICGLGQAAPNPLSCVLKYFPGRTEKAAWELVNDTSVPVKPISKTQKTDQPLGYGHDKKGAAGGRKRSTGTSCSSRSPIRNGPGARRIARSLVHAGWSRGRGVGRRDDLAGRARLGTEFRICAVRRNPAIAPTAIAAPAWSRSRASGCSPPRCVRRPTNRA